LTNAIDAVDWFDEPAVQIELCEACGYAHCASGGYVHVSRIGHHVLWTAPDIDLDDPVEPSQYRPSEPVRRHGAVAIPVEEWQRWRREFADLPSADAFPLAVRRDLLAAWRDEAPIFGEYEERARLVQLVRERAVAAEPSSLDQALADVEAVAAWLSAEPNVPVDGELVPLSDDRAVMETIYFDVPDAVTGPHLREWTPTARLDGTVFAVFGGGLVLVP
jgi:hypothetical protein